MAKQSSTTDKKKSTRKKTLPKKISQEDFNYLLSIQTQTNEYKIAYYDVKSQLGQIDAMITAQNEKEAAFTNQLAKKHNIPEGKIFVIEENLDITVKKSI